MKRYGCSCAGVTVIALLIMLFLAAVAPVFAIPLVLLFGWVYFLIHTLPEMSVEPIAFAVGGVALAAAIVLTHTLASWYWGSRPAKENSPRETWRFRWTASLVFLVVFVFAAGIALTSTIHEVGWIFTSKEPFITMPMEAARRSQSTNNLKYIGLGMHNYHDKHQRFAPGGTFDHYGAGLHSWETLLLPYIEDSAKPNLELPWHHPVNKEHFEKELAVFFNPSMTRRDPARKDSRGFALSHYSLNSHIARPNVGMSVKEVTDGTANTIMAGEANGNFRPWGDPVNWRDPTLGIDRSPDGFGGAHPGGAVFLFADGSARFLSETLDPEVLKALSTPAGGETLEKGLFDP